MIYVLLTLTLALTPRVPPVAADRTLSKVMTVEDLIRALQDKAFRPQSEEEVPTNAIRFGGMLGRK